MKYINIVTIIYLVVYLSGCGGADSGASHKLLTDKNTLYVNNIEENNHSRAFSTLTAALAFSIDIPKTIYLAGGEYSKKTGENFPLSIPPGTKLIRSDENNKSVNFIGYGNYNGQVSTMELNGNNLLSGITINSNENIGIVSNGNGNIVTGVTIIGNSVGIAISDDSNITVSDCNISENFHGIELSQTSSVSLALNTISKNTVGIMALDDTTVSFSSDSYNILTQNILCDFIYESTNSIKVDNVIWDTNIYDLSIKNQCKDGNDIVNVYGVGSIDFQFIPDIDTPLFPNNIHNINILNPRHEEDYSQVPSFQYENSLNSKYYMMAIWKSPPVIKSTEIGNPDDIVWFWHSGMGKVTNGTVNFSNGSIPKNGNLNPSNSEKLEAIPLVKGRGYYFAMWEWDSNAINIISSSDIVYFRVPL